MNKYDIILEVYRTGNISKTASKLNYSQSAISQIVSSFEKELGFAIFKRLPSGIVMTNEGKELLSHLQVIAQEENRIQQIARKITNLDSGLIRIGTFQSVSLQWLPRILKNFSEVYPNVRYELRHGDYASIQQEVNLRQIDCCFTTSIIPFGKLSFTPLLEDEYMVILPKGHPLSRNHSISLRDLSGERLIVPVEGLDYDLGNIFCENGFSPNIYLRNGGDDISTAALVEAGIGVSILNQLTLTGISKNISCRPFKEHYFRRLGIAACKEPYFSPVLEKFFEFVKSFIEKEYNDK